MATRESPEVRRTREKRRVDASAESGSKAARGPSVRVARSVSVATSRGNVGLSKPPSPGWSRAALVRQRPEDVHIPRPLRGPRVLDGRVAVAAGASEEPRVRWSLDAAAEHDAVEIALIADGRPVEDDRVREARARADPGPRSDDDLAVECDGCGDLRGGVEERGEPLSGDEAGSHEQRGPLGAAGREC